ncbi:MAG: hypothetical protein HOL80_01790 [Candidatus Magasanikbacteria bacterium]|jgi:hypothetical protein|nr:hypothetical protein [Candidatus Magasanikbacteria bacterium]MBT5820214.1 hypothetical protein [Candidatus Magasanikbacteria bacterium]MBT6294193.1 hypothetical protein [Candidatus Magasanikbacteria bacterium]
MSQETCAEVKKMLKDMQEEVDRLRSVFDSGGSMEDIKKGLKKHYIKHKFYVSSLGCGKKDQKSINECLK